MSSLPIVGDVVQCRRGSDSSLYTGVVEGYGSHHLPTEEPVMFWLRVTHVDGNPVGGGEYPFPLIMHINDLVR